MGAEGLKVVDPYFRHEYMVNQIDRLYEDLLQLNSKFVMPKADPPLAENHKWT
jgi:hypothetical protein